jgi:hypothetical protein
VCITHLYNDYQREAKRHTYTDRPVHLLCCCLSHAVA